MFKRKYQIVMAVFITVIGLAILSVNKYQQSIIDTKVAKEKAVLTAQEHRLKTIADSQKVRTYASNPIAQKSEQHNREVKLIQNNANAFFKLLYTVNKDDSQQDLNIRKRNQLRYATSDAIVQTGLNIQSIKSVKKYDETAEHLSATASVNVPDSNKVYSGIIKENFIQSSINFTGKHNQSDWYLFEYDAKTQKFTKFILLGFNFTHES